MAGVARDEGRQTYQSVGQSRYWSCKGRRCALDESCTKRQGRCYTGQSTRSVHFTCRNCIVQRPLTDEHNRVLYARTPHPALALPAPRAPHPP